MHLCAKIFQVFYVVFDMFIHTPIASNKFRGDFVVFRGECEVTAILELFSVWYCCGYSLK